MRSVGEIRGFPRLFPPTGEVYNPSRAGAAASLSAHGFGHVWGHVELILHSDDGHPLCEY